MSVNATTVNSITDNLISVLTDLSGFLFEKDSIGPKINTWVQLNVGRDNEEENHGEGPMYIEQQYEIVAQREIADKSDHRIKGAQIKWDIKEAITVATLNIEDLASSKLIFFVEQDSNVNDYSSSERLVVTVNVTVRFRDLRN